jgi:hypothetical protein
MINVVGALCFGIFVCVALAATVASARGTEADVRRWITRLILVCLTFSLSAALLHKEIWPFSRWNIFSEHLPQPVYELRVVGVDANGSEHDIDRRAFEPFTSIDLYTWLDFHFAKLSAEEKQEAAQYLLCLTNNARLAALNGDSIGSHGRFLHQAAAPVHILHARIWDDASAVPRDPFVGLKIYIDRWNTFDRRRDPSAVRHEVRYEYFERRP